MKRLLLCFVFYSLILCFSNSRIFAQDGSDSDNIATRYLSEADARNFAEQWDAEAVKKSIVLFARLADHNLKSQNQDKAIECFLEIGRLEIILGNKSNAQAFFKKALDLSTARNYSMQIIASKSQLALIELENGNFSRSRQYFESAIHLAKKTSDSNGLAKAYFAAAEFYYYKRELEKAANLYRQTAELATSNSDKKTQANALLYLGYTLMDQLLYAAAENSLLDALQKSQEINNKRLEVFSLIALGNFYSNTNDSERALQIYQKAELLFPENIDFISKARLLNGLGTVYENYQDWKLSAIYRERALGNFQEANQIFGQLATLESLVKLSIYSKNEAGAQNYLKRGQSLAKTIGDFFFRAIFIEQEGNLVSEKAAGKALLYYEKAIRLHSKAQSFHQHIGRLQLKKGLSLVRLGKTKQAETVLLKALEYSQRYKDLFVKSETLYNLGRLSSANNAIRATNLTTESILLTEKIYENVFNSKLKANYLSGIYERYELSINLFMRSHKKSPNEDYALQALQVAEKSRARAMLENLALSEANFLKDADAKTVRREKEIRVLLNAKADKLTDLLSQNAEKSETDKISNEIGNLENELENIKAQLKQQSPVYSAIKNPTLFDVAEFQRNVLDENSLLLEFFFDKEESYLWLVSKTEVASYVLPPRERLESHIEKLRKLIDSREPLEDETVENYQARIVAAETEFEREATDFSRELLGQVADKLANKRLIIVPDGKLHYFPIAALPFPNSTENLPILLTNETVYEPSAATLALLMRNGQKTSVVAPPKNLLVFFDPIFSAQDARIAAGEVKNEAQPATDLTKTENFRFAESLTSLARLNASRDEADAIIEIVGASASTALDGAAAARERALDKSIADYKIVHFATHGLIDEKRPELSGIVLSQIDENGQTRNGVVRLQDIYAMNLRADAVVLSACSTGIGKEVKGEGLLSLNNAFLQTGAKSVVASLWKVEDSATRELMKNFYRELASGRTTAEALRRAQINLRQNPRYQSPFYWAAFTVQGDYKAAPQFVGDFDKRLYWLLILPFALVSIYIYRRRIKLFDRKIININ